MEIKRLMRALAVYPEHCKEKSEPQSSHLQCGKHRIQRK
jgi:hypothetical protein